MNLCYILRGEELIGFIFCFLLSMFYFFIIIFVMLV